MTAVTGSIALAAISLAALTSCRRPSPEEVTSESVVTVKVARAERASIRSTVHATGVVSPAPDGELVVVAPAAARIAEIPHATGDTVRRGDLLVRFEIPGAAADVERQEAELVRARATVENARAGQVRVQGLFDRGVAARKEVEETNRNVAEADAMIAQAQASLAAARTLADRSLVRATFDGVVSKRQHNPGDLVEAAASDPVLRVVDLRRLEVVAAIPLADALRVAVGSSARLVGLPAGAGDPALKVLTRPAAVEAGTATIPVRLGFNERPNLPVGLPVQVDIDAEQHTNVVTVPSTAIVREGNSTAVFVAHEEKAERRPVDVGLSDGRRVEVTSGIDAGDQIIVDGQAGLPDGAAIAIAGDGETPTAPDRGAAGEKDAGK
jgi:RND family efflux transporter MFP subunit